jgi:hypothetical protein
MKNIFVSTAFGIFIGYIVFISDILMPYYHDAMGHPVMFWMSWLKAQWFMVSIGMDELGAYVDLVSICATISIGIWISLTMGQLVRRAFVRTVSSEE